MRDPKLLVAKAKQRISEEKPPAPCGSGSLCAHGDTAQPPSKGPGSDGDVPGCPGVKTLLCHCREYWFDPWSGN